MKSNSTWHKQVLFFSHHMMIFAIIVVNYKGSDHHGKKPSEKEAGASAEKWRT